jgi:hypothetical protein
VSVSASYALKARRIYCNTTYTSTKGAPWSAGVRCCRTPASEAKLQLFCPCLAVTAARCALYWQRLTLALVGAPHASKGLSPNSSKEDSGFLHVATASIVMHGAH